MFILEGDDRLLDAISAELSQPPLWAYTRTVAAIALTFVEPLVALTFYNSNWLSAGLGFCALKFSLSDSHGWFNKPVLVLITLAAGG